MTSISIDATLEDLFAAGISNPKAVDALLVVMRYEAERSGIYGGRSYGIYEEAAKALGDISEIRTPVIFTPKIF